VAGDRRATIISQQGQAAEQAVLIGSSKLTVTFD